MQLNTLKPAEGAKHSKRRVGRGIGCTKGKTCGRGHKGQHSRSGASRKAGFEGGQMPLQRRIPKFGFTSRKARYTEEVRLHEIASIDADVITLLELKKANIVGEHVLRAKVIASGEITKAVKLQGISVTKGAKEAIEKAGGSIAE